ncbi:spore germination protein [Bacillus sp. Xin]|uniref:spore germination protein n=1 Tax=unclassified Bacillus (in: firmicutes) TaxID=185979 RepID=UPI0015740241|nr:MULTISPECIES: spore germination protein [unclassified Bacillus (in: firmicutes)]MBC6971332.1 spore germination protein [Bacillus sp. Xin]NSW35821.1 spore germination protein [Bacillus sp. Xin1]
MPAIIDGVIIETCNGTLNLGDKYNVRPIFEEKSYNGSGSSNSGFSVRAFNGISATDVCDKDVNDQGIQFTL